MSELIIKDSGVIAKAELDVMITTAKAYPRDPKRAVEYATQLATMDEETAQSCFYVLPRKDKDGNRVEVKGPSIRLAEIMANSWGNLHAATRIIENDGKSITAQGVAWDLESNVKITMDNKVSIVFGGKSGKPYTANADMQTMLSNAASAKALRNAIFKVVPKALVDRVYAKAMEFSVGDVKTVNAKVTEIFDKLIKMGLQKQDILDYYGHTNLTEFTVDELRSLIGIGTAIRDKMITLEEVFSVAKEAGDESTPTDRINDLLSSKTKPQLAETINAETGEVS